MATEWTLSQPCVFQAQTHPIISVCPIKRCFKRRFVNLECNKRPKRRLQNVKTCQFRMFHSQINVLAGGPKKGREKEKSMIRTYCAEPSVLSSCCHSTSVLPGSSVERPLLGPQNHETSLSCQYQISIER